MIPLDEWIADIKSDKEIVKQAYKDYDLYRRGDVWYINDMEGNIIGSGYTIKDAYETAAENAREKLAGEKK